MDGAFDLNLLNAFDALLEERHVTRAATRMRISQPAMSAALARLRRATGDELFVRGPHGLSPTPRALELAEPLQSALAEIRRALTLEEHFSPSAKRRTFRVATSDHPAGVLMPRIVARIAETAPGIDLRLTIYRDRRSAIGLLDEGRIDLAIGVDPGSEARILHERLYEDRFVSIARAGADPTVLSDPVAFAAANHLMISPEEENRGVVDDALGRLGLTRRTAVKVAGMNVAVAMVAESDLVTTLPSGMVPLSADAAKVVIAEPPVALEPVGFEMLWHRRTETNAAHCWFRDLVRRESAALPFNARSA